MNMRRAYQTLLWLYPRDFRASFASEMLAAFDSSATEHRSQGQSVYVQFALVELIGVLIGAGKEWVAKLTTDRSLRGRSLPDRLMMRPPGVPWEAYYGSALVDQPPVALPHELIEAQRSTDLLVRRIVQAIAHHDFEGARTYSYQERQARENLRILREKYKCSSDTWRSA
jgi:hypothetical protein